jgi:hypothetical protein
MAKKISEVSSGDIYNGQKDIRGIIRRYIQWPKRYQRYHQEIYTMAKKISEISSGDIYNGQKDIRYMSADYTSDIFLAIIYVS